jgi:hypothetical protein
MARKRTSPKRSSRTSPYEGRDVTRRSRHKSQSHHDLLCRSLATKRPSKRGRRRIGPMALAGVRGASRL